MVVLVVALGWEIMNICNTTEIPYIEFLNFFCTRDRGGAERARPSEMGSGRCFTNP